MSSDEFVNLEASATPPDPRLGLGAGHLKVWSLLIISGLIASSLAWFVGEKTLTFFEAPLSDVPSMGGGTVKLPTRDDQVIAESKNETIAFGTLGGLLGLFLGTAGGLVRGSIRLTIAAALLGLLLGGAIGTGLSLGALQLYNEHRDENLPDLLPVILLHLAIFGGIGATAGLAFGVGTGAKGAWKTAMIGGLGGAIVGAILADCGGALMFPNAKTNLPISETPLSRLFYRQVVAFAIFIGTGLAVADPRRPKSRIPR